MSTTEQTAPPVELSDEVAAAADAIADRLRTKTIEQVIAIGERTGWWPAELVDWVADGRQGPPPSGPAPYVSLRAAAEAARAAETARLDQLQHELADAGVVATDEDEPDAEYDADVGMSQATAEPVAGPSQLMLQGGGPEPTALPVAGSGYIGVLQARDLGVDHTYQRPLDEPRVKKMVTTWDPRLLGTIEVSDRGEGESPRYAVIDGQHRVVAAAQLSPAGGAVWLPCTIHEGLDVPTEALLFHERDRTTKKLTGFDRWRSRRVAGDVTVVAVERIAAGHGLRVDCTPADGVMPSYGAAEKLFKLGGEQLLDTALAVLTAAYDRAATGYQAPLLSGVGQFVHFHGSSVDIDRLTRALGACPTEQLRAQATAVRADRGGSLTAAMTHAIADRYNRTPGPGPRLGGTT